MIDEEIDSTEAAQDIAENVIRDIKSLFHTSPLLTLEAHYGISTEDPFEIVMLFIVTDLAGSEFEDVRQAIKSGLMEIFDEGVMKSYLVRWTLKHSPKST